MQSTKLHYRVTPKAAICLVLILIPQWLEVYQGRHYPARFTITLWPMVLKDCHCRYRANLLRRRVRYDQKSGLSRQMHGKPLIQWIDHKYSLAKP